MKNQHRQKKWLQESSQHLPHLKERIPAIESISVIELEYLTGYLKWMSNSQKGSEKNRYIVVQNVHKKMDNTWL